VRSAVAPGRVIYISLTSFRYVLDSFPLDRASRISIKHHIALIPGLGLGESGARSCLQSRSCRISDLQGNISKRAGFLTLSHLLAFMSTSLPRIVRRVD
jgi:hypothetical protein